MLDFVGLGLYDEHSVTLEGRDAIREADAVYAEFYTSRLTGCSLRELENFHGREIEVLDRGDVEDSDVVVDAAEDRDVVFLTAGDTMVSTTHTELRLRAEERGVETRLVHAPSAASAVSGVTGLQNYRFGRSTSLVERDGWTPSSPYDVVLKNLERGLHTLIYLDIDVSPDGASYMTADEGARALMEMGDDLELVVGVARMGSNGPHVYGGSPQDVADHDYGEPLHLLVAPGELHDVERRYLKAMGNVNFDAPPNGD